MIEFKSTIYGTVHAYAVVQKSDLAATSRRIAAQARGKGATGAALRREVVEGFSSVSIHVAYRLA